MRQAFSSFCRLIASILVMTVLTSGMAMAAYVCPQLASVPVEEMVMEMATDAVPCAEMDKVKPVHCGEFQSGAQLALEHLAAPPALTPVFAAFVIPASLPAIPVVVAAAQRNSLLETGTDPPYLRTLRLRI
jgi:hypothetical protein